MKQTLLVIEAVIAGLPSMVVATGGLAIFLYAGFSMLNYDPISGAEGILVAVGIAFALVQYGLLASKTVQAKLYRFGWSFWLAVPFAALAVHFTFGGFFSIGYALLIAGPIVFATLHFVVIQLRLRRRLLSEAVHGHGAPEHDAQPSTE